MISQTGQHVFGDAERVPEADHIQKAREALKKRQDLQTKLDIAMRDLMMRQQRERTELQQEFDAEFKRIAEEAGWR